MKRTTIVIADDHAVLREGLRVAIDIQADLKVVGEAGTSPDAVERVRTLTPCVLCLDLSMPGWGMASTIERVRAASPTTRVLVLTMHDDPAYVRSAMAAGADGYVLKSTPLTALVTAIRAVAAGRRVIDESLRETLGDGPNQPKLAGPQALSRRERDVLELLVRGHTHQEISDKLFVSVKTVETYRARLRKKIGLKSRADLVRYGIETGLLSQPDAFKQLEQG